MNILKNEFKIYNSILYINMQVRYFSSPKLTQSIVYKVKLQIITTFCLFYIFSIFPSFPQREFRRLV